jgi:hypothetical protein
MRVLRCDDAADFEDMMYCVLAEEERFVNDPTMVVCPLVERVVGLPTKDDLITFP